MVVVGELARIPSFSLERHGGGGGVKKKEENDTEKRK